MSQRVPLLWVPIMTARRAIRNLGYLPFQSELVVLNSEVLSDP